MTPRFLVADVFDGLATLEDNSVDLIVTSPPFLALRSYLPADHPDKSKEIGSEATPAEFLDVLLAVTAEWRRVLAPHGSICVELGDTYAGSGGAGGDYLNAGLREGQPGFDGSAARGRAQDREYEGGASDRWDFAKPGTNSRLASGPGWPLAKSKTLIPELYRLALAYGRNPLRYPLSARELLSWVEIVVETTREAGALLDGFDLLRMMNDYVSKYEELELGPYKEYERWLVRNVVTWCRPNPPVGALGDKWRPATSDVVVAATSPKRYWDDLATRKPVSDAEWKKAGQMSGESYQGVDENGYRHGRIRKPDPAGAPLLDYWEIPPGGYKGSHYAVFPPELVVPLVKAMCPQKVCRVCGEPSRRIVEPNYVPDFSGGTGRSKRDGSEPDGNERGIHSPDAKRMSVAHKTLGFTDCGHDDYRPGLVLDPFAGSGTTLMVAHGHGFDTIGIDLDERNAELALQRVGPMFLEVEVSP